MEKSNKEILNELLDLHLGKDAKCVPQWILDDNLISFIVGYDKKHERIEDVKSTHLLFITDTESAATNLNIKMNVKCARV